MKGSKYSYDGALISELGVKRCLHGVRNQKWSNVNLFLKGEAARQAWEGYSFWCHVPTYRSVYRPPTFSEALKPIDTLSPFLAGATIRVDVIFNRILSTHRHKLVDKICNRPGLVLVTQEKNIQSAGDMGNMPAKHIGIILWPWVYHYSNTQNKVKKEDVTRFMNTFTSAYAGNGPVVFYRGEFIE